MGLVFQLDEVVVVVEFTAPASWVESIRDLEIRDQFQLNIIGYRDAEDQPLRSQIVPTLSARRGARDGGDRQPIFDRIQDQRNNRERVDKKIGNSLESIVNSPRIVE